MGTPASVVALMINKDGQVCRTTRRNKPKDLSLPGGSIEDGRPGRKKIDASPFAALCRETEEETGVKVIEAHMIYERVDPTDGGIAWCYHVTKWAGEPRSMEPGIEVSWGDPRSLLTPDCTFREYNRGLFLYTNLVEDAGA